MKNRTIKQIRCSNIELLRIVALLLIMLGHTHLRISPFPRMQDACMEPLSSFGKLMLSCIATTGVGIFIAISGWFGIKFRVNGLAKYLFSVVFILWTVYGLAIAFHLTDFNMNGILYSLTFYEGYWFVIGYLGLYLISPLLNSFIEHASKREYQIVLLSYYLFQSYYSWTTAWYDYYNGYSIILFGGIYLTAAYLRKYPIEWLRKHAEVLLVGVFLLMTIIAYLSTWKLGHAGRQIRDDNPLVIFAAILLLLSFSKRKFQSRIVNWLAASCFAVYLIHFSPFVYPYFMKYIQLVYSQFDGLAYGIMLILALFSVFLACTLYDQIRILVWNGLNKKASRRRQ